MDQGVAEFLRSVAVFADLEPALLEQVAAKATTRAIDAGDWLFRQHDRGDALYVVKAGRLELVREDPPPDTSVGLLGPGDSLGELSLLLNEPRTLSVRAIRDSELVRLDRSEVLALLNESQEFTTGVTKTIAGYLQDRAMHRNLADVHGNVLTIVSLGPPIADLRAAMAAIPARRRVAVLTAHEATDYREALDQAERDNDRVFLLADEADGQGPWREFCLRQADRVVALIPSDLHPSQQPSLPDHADLVFWTARHAHTAAWITQVQPRSHHFVDPTTQHTLTTTLARALRRLAGLSTGVVLSGGGARTLAHIGVIAGLQEQGVNIDRIGGVSFGALIGAMFATGMSPTEITETCRRELVKANPFNDYTVPTVALLRGRKLKSALTRIFQQQTIEEAPIAFFAASADLYRSDLIVHRQGLFTDALNASLALPGMLPPVNNNTELLVDGGALNGLPIEVMAGDNEGPIIAVDVINSKLRIGRNRQSLPPILETISRSATIGGSSSAYAQRSLAHIVIEPDTATAGQHEFARIDTLIALGRSAAQAALASQDDPVTVG